MTRPTLPSPATRITKTEARRFMLRHHRLYPPRNIKGKQGVLDYIRHVGCIQFDPINIVGRNPDLVLQSRVQDYIPDYLDELLYSERKLLDGWDKMASIYSMTDWPYFSKRRDYMNQPGIDPRRPPEDELDRILEVVRKIGPVSSLDFDGSKIVDWYWGPTKIARAALESLFRMGKVGVHHRVNNRRSFDIVERLIPSELLQQTNPFISEQAYQDWHITRRVGSLGLASSKSGELWYGILGVKSRERTKILQRLTEKGVLVAIEIEGYPGKVFFIRAEDQYMLGLISVITESPHKAAVIAALDNLIWNRELIKQIFDFEYVWEVYKPKAQRKYGYYVLPIVYGDQFIARFEPRFNKLERELTIENWWWEENIKPTTDIQEALMNCLGDFAAYLHAEKLGVPQPLSSDNTLQWIRNVIL
jgi:uncharacterized protein YcaQ